MSLRACKIVLSIGSRANTPMVFKADCMAILEDSFFS
nr:MAG TPA_asm: hypothetical protein [Caudoviricetes sp.]